MARLGDYVKQIRGVSYKPEDLHASLDDSSIILLRANNIQDGKLVLDDVVFVDKSKVRAEQLLKQGDVLICTSSGSKELVGKAAFVEADMNVTFGAFCKVVRPVMEHPRYLGHYFNSAVYRKQISALSAGANINNIRGEHIDSLEIQIPSINEQVSRSNSLSKIDELISLRKKQLQKLDDLVKSRFVEMFGSIHDSLKYPYHLVKNLTEVVSGGTPSRDNPEYWNNGTIPWVKTTELQNKVISDVEEYITQKGLDESSAKLVPPNTVLIAMYGQGKTRGMTALLGVSACTNQACACMLPSDKITPVFLWKYFELSYDKLRNLAKGGNQPNLNCNMIKNFPVLLPPLKLQEEYVSYIAQIDKSKQKIQQGLDKLEQMKQVLMQKYFG